MHSHHSPVVAVGLCGVFLAVSWGTTSGFVPASLGSKVPSLALASSNNNNYFVNEDYDNTSGDYYYNNYQEGQPTYRMEKQSNGVYSESNNYNNIGGTRNSNPAASDDYRTIDANRYRPALTSPARALQNKQWDWKDTSYGNRGGQMVTTFSGNKKIGGPGDQSWDRDRPVDGTNYRPSQSFGNPGRGRMMQQRYPQPPRGQFQQPPPGRMRRQPPPPPFAPRREPRRQVPSNQRMNPNNLRYLRDENGYTNPDFLYEDDIPNSDSPVVDKLAFETKKLAQETEKFLRGFTNFGRPSRNNGNNFNNNNNYFNDNNSNYYNNNNGIQDNYYDSYPNNQANYDQLYGTDGYSSSSAVRSFEQSDERYYGRPPSPKQLQMRRQRERDLRQRRRPSGDYNGLWAGQSRAVLTDRDRSADESGFTPSHSSSPAVRSILSNSRARSPYRYSESGVPPPPRMKMQRQFNGDYKAVPIQDEYY